MSELGGIQQVLQLTPLVERVQVGVQPHPGDATRLFEHELIKINQEAREKTQETLGGKESEAVDEEESHAGDKRQSSGERHHRHEEPETKRKQMDLIAESGHGGLLDIKA